MGLIREGDIKGFFRENYEIKSADAVTSTFELKEGYILTDLDSKTWRVVTIIGERFFTNTMIFKSVILRNIDNSGT